MRNFYHILIGFAITYTIGLNSFSGFNLTFGNILGVTLTSIVISGCIGFIWEWLQSYKYMSFFDMNDVLRTAIGGLFGGLVSLFFVSQTLMISLIIISTVLIIKDLKR